MKVLHLRPMSAWIPMVMSLGALGTVLYHIAMFGVARQRDEGAAAHIWQLLMAGQIPIVAFYAVKWLPRAPKTALPILAVQLCAACAALAPVYFLGLVVLYLFANDIGRFHLFPGNSAYTQAHSFGGKFGALLLPWFFLTPIVYSFGLSAFHRHHSAVQALRYGNFVTPPIEALRAPLYEGRLPRLGDIVYLVVAAAIALALGSFVFSRVDDRIPVEL